MSDRLLWTLDELSEAMGVSRGKLKLLIAAGELESVKVGRCRRVPVEAVTRYLESARAGGAVTDDGAAVSPERVAAFWTAVGELGLVADEGHVFTVARGVCPSCGGALHFEMDEVDGEFVRVVECGQCSEVAIAEAAAGRVRPYAPSDAA